MHFWAADAPCALLLSHLRACNHPALAILLPTVDDVGLPINGIMGTSAGALIGSLYAAGYTPREVR